LFNSVCSLCFIAPGKKNSLYSTMNHDLESEAHCLLKSWSPGAGLNVYHHEPWAKQVLITTIYSMISQLMSLKSLCHTKKKGEFLKFLPNTRFHLLFCSCKFVRQIWLASCAVIAFHPLVMLVKKICFVGFMFIYSHCNICLFHQHISLFCLLYLCWNDGFDNLCNFNN
jgi:hypothetical protein